MTEYEKNKQFYLDWWTPTLGAKEALESWEIKQQQEKQQQETKFHYYCPDIQPYQSMATGEMIGGRSQHREHLKKHNLTEIGNETKYLKPKEYKPDPSIREEVARAVYRHRGPF